MSTAFQSDAFQPNAWQILAGTSEAPVEVPDVVGQDQATGTAALESAGFVVSVSTAASSQPAGTIVSQTPDGGSFALAGSTVTIVVSTGAALVEVEFESPFWWKREQPKPAAEKPSQKEEKRKAQQKKSADEIRAAREQAKQIIAEAAAEQVARGVVPKPERFAEVRTALKPLRTEGLLEGFNWPALYQRLYQEALDQAIKNEMQAALALQDQLDEEALLLLLAEA